MPISSFDTQKIDSVLNRVKALCLLCAAVYNTNLNGPVQAYEYLGPRSQFSSQGYISFLGPWIFSVLMFFREGTGIQKAEHSDCSFIESGALKLFH